MKHLRLSAHARADLTDIKAFGVGEWGPARAVRYARAIGERLKLLRQWSAAGVNLDEIRSGLRRIPVGSHAIYYVERGDYVWVVRILHHRMDHRRHLSDPD